MYSNGKVFLVGSLFMENVFGFEDGLENVGFPIFVSLFISCVKVAKWKNNSRRRLMIAVG
jgi:hypothetical protein